MWRVIYSLNPFSISNARDTLEHLKTRKPKHRSYRHLSSLPGSHYGRTQLHTWGSTTFSNSTQAPRRRCSSAPHVTTPASTVSVQHQNSLPSAFSYGSSMENGFFYISRWQLCKAFPWSLWHDSGRSVFSIIHDWRQFPFYKKGPWSPVPPFKDKP